MKKHLLALLVALPLSFNAHPGKTCCQKKTPTTQVSEDKQIEQTFAMIKPDATQKHTIGEIISLIEKNGFTIKNMQMRTFTVKEAEIFYAEHKGKPFFADLVSYMTSGPIVGLALEKENAVADWRELIGTTDPTQARPGTVRKMYAESKSKNAVHGSDSLQAAEREIKLIFG